jgi:hypothetical protein
MPNHVASVPICVSRCPFPIFRTLAVLGASVVGLPFRSRRTTGDLGAFCGPLLILGSLRQNWVGFACDLGSILFSRFHLSPCFSITELRNDPIIIEQPSPTPMFVPVGPIASHPIPRLSA